MAGVWLFAGVVVMLTVRGAARAPLLPLDSVSISTVALEGDVQEGNLPSSAHLYFASAHCRVARISCALVALVN